MFTDTYESLDVIQVALKILPARYKEKGINRELYLGNFFKIRYSMNNSQILTQRIRHQCKELLAGIQRNKTLVMN
jgi:hypothetical protein